MANGLLDPVYQIRPSKVDAIRRSWDPQGLLGASLVQTGHLALHGRTLNIHRVRQVAAGHLTFTGRTAVVHRQRPIARGHLTVTGGTSVQMRNVHWLTIPRFDLNWAAISYPYYINGIRSQYLIDTQGSVQS